MSSGKNVEGDYEKLPTRLKLIAKTLEGLESVLADELRELGASDVVPLKRAVACTGDTSLLYRANLCLRTCLRVLVFIREFPVRNEEDLYREIKEMTWESYMSPDDTLAIDSVVNSTRFRHANYIALKCKDAIADRFRERTGRRPSVDTTHPTLRIHIHIRETTVTVSLDSSGDSLHKRGYRKEQVPAPLNEVLAAGILRLSGWDASTPLLDPMCGSGTLLCEAAMIAACRPPQSPDRKFAFLGWRDADPSLWNNIVKECMSKVSYESMPSITGSDILSEAVKATKANVEHAGLGQWVQVHKEDFFFHEGTSQAFLIFNPPYDERLKEEDIVRFYQHIGDKLKLGFPGCTAWILSGHMEAIKHVGLRPSRRIPLLNGSIPSLLCRFDLYAGSRKAKWNQPSDAT